VSRHTLLRRTAFGAIASAFALAAAPAQASTACARLVAQTIPDLTVEHAAEMPAGKFAPGGDIALPAFCRVEAVSRPTPDSEIRIEVWIPLAAAWNGKFQGVGNGGYQGNIPYDAMAVALRHGYATAATDTGHKGDDLKFGEGHPEKLIDWGHRAIHLTAQAGKLIVRNATGRFPEHSYFVGCSTGGHQALSEAQRYPDDYDGIVAGDPGYDRVHQTAAYLYNWLALHDAAGNPLLTAADLRLVTRAAIAECDPADGLKDGIIADPRRCTFKPAQLLCKPGTTSGCLNAGQVAALDKVYRGLHNPRTGALIFPGWSVGSEGFGDAPAEGWGAFLIAPKSPMRSDVYKYLVFNDPAWDYRNFDYDRDVAYSDRKIPFMAATDTDLSAFRARGGKLLMYTGWADPVAAPLDVLQYYDRAAKTAGGYAALSPFFRFFMVPGMGHCRGGVGYDDFDPVAALETWVEKDQAPSRIIARRRSGQGGDRPLCPYPQEARWDHRGNVDAAASFVCVTPK
jgi:feruloyl esterase